jgi:pimeloyl-ACP methyl ester carboxylesterase
LSPNPRIVTIQQKSEDQISTMNLKHLFVVFAALFVCLVTARTFAQPTTAPANSWTDTSPHKVLFIKVNGITLEYLDWGGTGKPLLFLAGLGNTAHIFDDIAPHFTNHFHVLALTRRGYGKSDHPATGYDAATLVEDIRQFLDALKLERVILAGHSFAGVELCAFAQQYPDRIDKLVFFDCAYTFDQPNTLELLAQIDSLTPGPTPVDRATFPALLAWFRNNRPGWNAACESDLRNTRILTAEGYSSHGSTPDIIDEALVKVAVTYPRDYSAIKCPALAFFADHRLNKIAAESDGPTHTKALQITKGATQWLQDQIEQFKHNVKDATVVELPDTDHFCFIQRQDEVVRQMQSFLEHN